MRHYDDHQLGERIVTASRTVTETHIVQFCMLTGDWYPLHGDKHWAENEGPFGRRIAHGFLVISFAAGLMPLTEWAIVAFYGLDKVRFTAPTYIDDTLHVELEVAELQDKGESGGVVTFKTRVIDHTGVLKADYLTKVLMAKRPDAEGACAGATG